LTTLLNAQLLQPANSFASMSPASSIPIMMPPLGTDMEYPFSADTFVPQYQAHLYPVAPPFMNGHFMVQSPVPTDMLIDMSTGIPISVISHPSTVGPEVPTSMITEPQQPAPAKRNLKRKHTRTSSNGGTVENIGSPTASMTNLSISGETEPPHPTQPSPAAQPAQPAQPQKEKDTKPLNPEAKKLRRLEKNREAAQQFRQRQKNYILGLESQVDTLGATNKDLQERLGIIAGENKLLKEQLAYLRHFITKAMSFKGVDGVSVSASSTSTSSSNPESTENAIHPSSLPETDHTSSSSCSSSSGHTATSTSSSPAPAASVNAQGTTIESPSSGPVSSTPLPQVEGL